VSYLLLDSCPASILWQSSICRALSTPRRNDRGSIRFHVPIDASVDVTDARCHPLNLAHRDPSRTTRPAGASFRTQNLGQKLANYSDSEGLRSFPGRPRCLRWNTAANPKEIDRLYNRIGFIIRHYALRGSKCLTNHQNDFSSPLSLLSDCTPPSRG